ncbi:MAG TPA: acyl-ACP thioesterase domain-containing protein [Candidatus Limnocylindrales bacterium]
MLDPADATTADLDPGLTGRADRPVGGIDNGFVAGYRVRFDEAGPDGRIRTSALLRYAQDVAWRHSEDLGFDRQWYLARGRWWVVRAVDLEVMAPIAMGRTLGVSTAVVGHRRIWARRLADARLGSGASAQLGARIVTDWVILDEAGRLVRIPADFGLSFTNPELRGEILRVAAPGAAPETALASEIRFGVRPHDLDPMGHVNNAAYLDWVEEGLLAAGAEPGVVPRRARLEYLASAAPGDEITVATTLRGRRWTSRITRSGGGELMRAVGELGGAAAGGARADTPGLGDIEGVPPAV